MMQVQLGRHTCKNSINTGAEFSFVVPTSITSTATSNSTITATPITESTNAIVPQTSTQRIITSTTVNSTAPQTSTSTSSKSVPVGAIVGGIIAGLIVITAILAFTCYKVSAHRQMHVLHDEPFYYGSGKPLTPGSRVEKRIVIGTEEYEMEKPRTESQGAVAIRYPEFSANIAGDY
jgi:hypothetical protein